ncbi:MAG: hypothetical protein ACYC27_15665 [Armatimonadota bacterium]
MSKQTPVILDSAYSLSDKIPWNDKNPRVDIDKVNFTVRRMFSFRRRGVSVSSVDDSTLVHPLPYDVI